MNHPLTRILTVASVVLVLGIAAIGLGRTSSGVDTATDRPVGAAPAVADPIEPVTASDLDALLAADRTVAGADGEVTRGAIRRLAAWRHLVHATVVVDLPKAGGLTTIQLDHGTISAVSATSLTIAEAGGGSVTVTLGGETHVRRDGGKAAVGDLKAADEVFVMSKVETGGADAYLVVIPKG